MKAAVAQVMWLMVKVASCSAQETMAVVHNPMGEEEEMKLQDTVGTKGGNEEELPKQQEALVLQSYNYNQHPPFPKKRKKVKALAKVEIS